MDELLRATAQAEGSHFWFRGFRAFVTPLVRQALEGRTSASILDCGCGTGANVQWLSDFGRTFGFDLTMLGLRLGQEAGRRRLARATVTAAPFPTNTFDLVTSFDVLYALEPADERAAVSEMFRLTRPGGYALINVAALEILRGDHSILGHELHRYNRSDLGQVLTGAGFSIVRLTYTNFTILPLVAVARLVQRWRGLAREEEALDDISVPWAPVNELLTGVLLLESAWVRRFNCPLGSSLLCLARKPA